MTNDPWTLGEKAITSLMRQLDAERALADDLAAVLGRVMFKGGEIMAVLARHREARQR